MFPCTPIGLSVSLSEWLLMSLVYKLHLSSQHFSGLDLGPNSGTHLFSVIFPFYNGMCSVCVCVYLYKQIWKDDHQNINSVI